MTNRLAAIWIGLAVWSGATSAGAQDWFQQARLTPQADIETQLGELPAPLTQTDAQRYRQIFELQSEGLWRKADKLIAQLSNELLLGHVRAQRYLHPTAYRSSFEELRDWLTDYADLPQAARIHKLAQKRRPSDATAPPEPVAGYLGGSGQELLEERQTDYVSEADRPAGHDREVARWLDEVKSLVSRDRPTQATRLLNDRTAELADTVELDLARWKIARGYFANQKDEEALVYAEKAAERSGHIEPRLHWTAGLAAWRLNKVEKAARHFAALGRSDAPGEDVAAGAFWAARAYQALSRFDQHQRFMNIAAGASDDFYGQLAQKIIGVSASFDWHEEGLRGELRRLVDRFPATRRAMALAQIGQRELAAKEIRKLAARARPQLTQALAALAESLALPAAQMRVAQRLRLLDGRRHDGAMYPLPPWQPLDGFKVDRALLYALARAESGFNPEARSHADARGLMQILPSTAKKVAREIGFKLRHKNDLYDPALNLTLGQAYVHKLLGNHLIDGSLLHLAIAYNAGLSRLQDWDARLAPFADDPLMFLESVPIPETRNYAKKVMANLWAYQARLDQNRLSLTELAQSQWPTYQPLDPGLSYAWSN